MRNKKRYLAAVMAMTLAAGLAVPSATTANAAPKNYTVINDGEYREEVTGVEVDPTTGEVKVTVNNGYTANVTIKEDVDNGATVTDVKTTYDIAKKEDGTVIVSGASIKEGKISNDGTGVYEVSGSSTQYVVSGDALVSGEAVTVTPKKKYKINVTVTKDSTTPSAPSTGGNNNNPSNPSGGAGTTTPSTPSTPTDKPSVEVKPDGSKVETTVEKIENGTVTTQVTQGADGSKTESKITETKAADGSTVKKEETTVVAKDGTKKTVTVEEKKNADGSSTYASEVKNANGSTIAVNREVKADGSKVTTKVTKSAAGNEVKKVTTTGVTENNRTLIKVVTTKKTADGKETTVAKTRVGFSRNLSAMINEIGDKMSATLSVNKGAKAGEATKIAASVLAQITEQAGTKKMPVTVSVKNGTKTVYNVQVVDAEALATGKALKMYRVTKGGKMAELAADLYTINKDGSFTVKGQKNHTYRIQ